MQNLSYNTNTVREFDEIPPVVITMSDESRRKELKRQEALEWFLNDIAEARRISDDQGWIPFEEIEKEFGLI